MPKTTSDDPGSVLELVMVRQQRGRLILRGAAILFPAALLIGACAGPEQPMRLAAMEHKVPQNRIPSYPFMLASASGSYLAGNHAQRTRDYAAAAEFLSSALEIDSKNKRLRRRTFLAMLADGRMDRAIGLAPGILDSDTSARLAAITLAVKDAKAGKFEAVEKRLGALPRRGVNTYLLPLLTSWAVAAQGRTTEALEGLKPLAGKSDLAVLHDLHVGLINDVAGNRDAAEKAFVSAAGPNTPLRIILALGSLYERMGRAADAKAVYSKYITANPDTRVLDSALKRIAAGGQAKPPAANHAEGLAEAFFNMAGTVTQGRSVEFALLYGRIALYLRPNFPVAQLLVAGILETLGRNAEAIAVYDTVDEKSAFYWNARLRKASALDSLSRVDDAIKLLSSMADEDDARTDVLITLADLLRGKKRYRQSIDIYSRAIGRIPKLTKRHWSLLYARGISLERSKEWRQAEKDFLNALQLYPDQPYVLNYLGYSWVDQGINLERAQGMIKRAVKLRPNDGYIVDSLGWVLYRLGDFSGATKQLERAVELRPQDPTINDHLGDAYWKVGRVQEAMFQWRRALSLDPEPELIPTIRKKIDVGLTNDKPGGRDG